MRLFVELLGVTPETSVVDIGGTSDIWSRHALHPRVTSVNLLPQPGRCVIADARSLPFGDRTFDVAFCNSVIEHAGTLAYQTRVAAECRRVGNSYFVETPSVWFPVEPHYLGPFVHWLPKPLRRRLVRWFSLWGWIKKPTRDEVSDRVDEIRLLGARELQQLFPDGCVVKERWCGITKAYYVYRARG